MNGKINFFTEEIDHVIRKKGDLRNWIICTIEEEGKTAGTINFVFCNDIYLSELNFKYLKKNSLTDILTFSSTDDNGLICSDIFISIERVTENAVIFKQKMTDELHRVMIHGILHSIGFNDLSRKEKFVMREKENLYLEKLKSKQWEKVPVSRETTNLQNAKI